MHARSKLIAAAAALAVAAAPLALAAGPARATARHQSAAAAPPASHPAHPAIPLFTGNGTIQQSGTSSCAAVNGDSGNTYAKIVMTACGTVPSQEQSFAGDYACSGGDHVIGSGPDSCPFTFGSGFNAIYGGDLIVYVKHRDNGKCWAWFPGVGGLTQQACEPGIYADMFVEAGSVHWVVSVFSTNYNTLNSPLCGGPNGTQITATSTCADAPTGQWNYRSN